MAKYFCSNCDKYVKRGNFKDFNCPECGEHLKYIGSCGECLEFQEFYDGVGTCDYKLNVRKDNQGCDKFK